MIIKIIWIQHLSYFCGFLKNKQKKARENFQKRHKKNIKKGIFYPGYWANKVKW